MTRGKTTRLLEGLSRRQAVVELPREEPDLRTEPAPLLRPGNRGDRGLVVAAAVEGTEGTIGETGTITLMHTLHSTLNF